MFYNVTFHRMSHFGSSKHSSILWGFALFLKKKQSKKKQHLLFVTHTLLHFGRGVGQIKQRECFSFHHIQVAQSFSHVSALFTFNLLFWMAPLIQLALSEPWMWPSCKDDEP